MGDWVRCPVTARPTLTGTLMAEVGLYEGSLTTFVHTVSVGALGFIVSIVWTADNVYNPTGHKLRDAESGDPGLDGPYHEFIVNIGVDLVEGAETTSSGGPQYYYVGQNGAVESLPLEIDFTLTGGHVLWRQLVSNPPSTRGARYWWDFSVLDGWANDPEAWFEAEIVGPAGTSTFAYRYPDLPEATGGSFYSLEYLLTLSNDDPYLQSFAATAATYARIDLALDPYGVDLSDIDEAAGTGWTVEGSEGSVAAVYAGSGSNGFTTWTDTRALPAIVDPQLVPVDIGGPTEATKSSVEVNLTGPDSSVVTGTVGGIAPYEVEAGAEVMVTTNEDWAELADEVVTATRGESSPMPTITNLPWKLDVPPPGLAVGDPYFTGPAAVTKWSWLGLLTGKRIYAALGDCPPENAVTSEQPVDADLFWEWNEVRWAADNATLAYSKAAEALTATCTDTGLVTLTRDLVSYWQRRQTRVGETGAVSIPECYRVTAANQFWPDEPGLGTGGDGPGTAAEDDTQPEDFYDWAAFRYLAFKVDADRYPVTVTATIDYLVPTVSDNHLTGSTRAEEYAVSYAAGQLVVEVAVSEAGWYACDLWEGYPRPRVVTQLALALDGLQAGDDCTIGPLGLSQDLPTVDRPTIDPGDHARVKWLCDWSGGEVLAAARADGLPALLVADGYQTRREKGLPYIDWLFGATSGADLSRALTFEEALGLFTTCEGWHGEWSDAEWEEQTTCEVEGVTKYLSDGYPWDARWTAGEPVSNGTLLDCCIGARSWQLAGGLVYPLHARQVFRGRVDGILTSGGAPLRDGTGIETTGNGVSDLADSNAHAAWWTPPLCEQDGVTGAALVYEVATWQGGVYVLAYTVTAECGAWLWGADLAAFGGRIDAVLTPTGQIVLVRPSSVRWAGVTDVGSGLVVDCHSRYSSAGAAPYHTRRPGVEWSSPAVTADAAGRLVVIAESDAGLEFGQTSPRAGSMVEMATLSGHTHPAACLDIHSGQVLLLARRTSDGVCCFYRTRRPAVGDDPEFGDPVAELGDCDAASGALVMTAAGVLYGYRVLTGEIHSHVSLDGGRNWSELT